MGPHILKAMKLSNIKNNEQIKNELHELCQQYYNDINSGNQVIHRNAGYNGKGYKYDKHEQLHKNHIIERQKYVYGQKEELQEWNINKVDQIEQVLDDPQNKKNDLKKK